MCVTFWSLPSPMPEAFWMRYKRRSGPSRRSRNLQRSMPIVQAPVNNATCENSSKAKWSRISKTPCGQWSLKQCLRISSKRSLASTYCGCMKSSYRSELTPSLVGDPGFEPGSKRPKRPSIGQANPIALAFRPTTSYL